MNDLRVDLNCDMGESFGAYSLGNDARLLDFVTSANIACGFHAGDPGVMASTVRLAIEKGVAIGAHPGFPDLQGFGRRLIRVSPEEAGDMVTYQIGALDAFIRAEGGTMHHVKAHGALYNAAATDPGLASAITQAVHRFSPDLILFGLSGSEMITAARAIGLRAASEAFADRTYQRDGTLTPRHLPNALIEDSDIAVEQARRLVHKGSVRTTEGNEVSVRADTICIHGDGPKALPFARLIRDRLETAGVTVARSDGE